MTRTEIAALKSTEQTDTAGRVFVVTKILADYGTPFVPSCRWILQGRTIDTDGFAFKFVPRVGH